MSENIYDSIIVGGGPAGLSAMLYLGRALTNSLLIEKKGIGGQMMNTDTIENYLGFPEEISSFELVDRMQKHAEKFSKNPIEYDEDGKIAIYKLAKSYGIGLKDWQDSNLIIKNSENIKDLTNIKKVNSIMHRDIISKGEEEVKKDLERRYLNMITNISNKAESIKNTNSESKKTLDMTKAEQENFKHIKNKEIEEIEKAMKGLNEAFENIKTEWLNQNKKLKEAIKK